MNSQIQSIKYKSNKNNGHIIKYVCLYDIKKCINNKEVRQEIKRIENDEIIQMTKCEWNQYTNSRGNIIEKLYIKRTTIIKVLSKFNDYETQKLIMEISSRKKFKGLNIKRAIY